MLARLTEARVTGRSIFRIASVSFFALRLQMPRSILRVFVGSG
ncbi:MULTISPECIES: hypothetical protein [Brucella]|nr:MULTISPECIES: hypothetical protein [Brucella]